MSNGLPPLAWLSSRHYSRLLRTLATPGPEGDDLANQYRGMLAETIPAGQIGDRRVLAKHVMTAEIARERGLAALDEVDVRAELRLVQPLHHFISAGRQVFEFSGALADELARTDVDEVLPEDIRTPYDAFYLRLPGILPDVEGRTIDGMLVQNLDYRDIGRTLMLDFLPVFLDEADFARAIPAMPIASVPLRGEDSVGDGMTVANLRIAKTDFLRDGAASAGINHHGKKWFEQTVENVQMRYDRGVEYAQECLPILINALLFIDNCHSEQIRGWSPDAPADLAAKASSGGTGSAKAEQRLVREGWAKVTLCQVEDRVRDGEPGDQGRSVRAHWRRGHWRRQAVGPGRTRTKLIRVRPTMVGTGEVQEGRVYKAKGTSPKEGTLR